MFTGEAEMGNTMRFMTLGGTVDAETVNVETYYPWIIDTVGNRVIHEDDKALISEVQAFFDKWFHTGLQSLVFTNHVEPLSNAYFKVKISRQDIWYFSHSKEKSRHIYLNYTTGSINENGQEKNGSFLFVFVRRLLLLDSQLTNGKAKLFQEPLVLKK